MKKGFRQPSELASPWRFDLQAEVGRGTSGTVWRARDQRTGNLVAVKVAHDEAAAQTIANEAETLLLVDSAFIPSVIDLGRAPGRVDAVVQGSAYVVLRWVSGVRLDPRAIPPDRRSLVARVVARDIGGALDDLHQAGMAHGDVKPDNVLLLEEGGEDRAMLVDLGYATELARGGIRGATLRYAPPELGQGRRRAAAHDLYGLGVCLSEVIDPMIAEASDPVAQLWSRQVEAPWGALLRAMTAFQPSARPPASWIRGAVEKQGPARARRIGSRVRASYLRVRRWDLERARGASRWELRGDVAPWLGDAVKVVRSAHALRGGEVERTGTLSLSPLDAAGRKRWLVALVGTSATAWTLPPALTELPESKLAGVLDRLESRLDPGLWTLQDVLRAVENDLPSVGRGESTKDLVDLALGLLGRPTGAEVLEQAETLARRGSLPLRHRLLLAESLRSAGNMGRAYAALDGCADLASEALRADLLRRMGNLDEALRVASRLVRESGSCARPGEYSHVERATAVWARVLLDRGDSSGALDVLGSHSSAAAAEVRSLAHLSRGETKEALAWVEVGLSVATDEEERARLHCVRGMEAHARGQSQVAREAFSRAADCATRAGATVEEATYLTGVAAAAVDTGHVAEALEASHRAFLMWELLDQPGRTAYALLARASAFSLAGDTNDARKEASLGLAHAKRASDGRVTAFLQMLMSDMASPEESLGFLEDARRVLGSTPLLDDELRLEARCLRAGALSEEEIGLWDRKSEAEGVGITAKAEWWASRARSWVQGRRVGRDAAIVARMIRLVREPMPVGVRGPAVDAARALAAQAGDGESARLLSSMQVKLSLDFLEHVPSWLREHAVSVGWVLEAQGDGDSVARARNLEMLVRSLAGRESLRGLLDRALDALVLWTGVERGLLLLRAPGDRLVVRAARNLERRDLQGEQVVLSHSLARRALTSREPVVAVDAAGEIADVHHSVHALGLRSVLAVPLLARGDVLGVAYLDDRVRVGAFGPQELSWVRLVAGIAAMAIADARAQLLLRREARRAERAEARVKEDLARREVELEQVQRALASGEGRRRRGYEAIVGESEAVRTMLSLVERVAATDLPVLVEGESGSGKELVARALHEHGARAREPFVTENCSAIPEPLFESTLFGHVRGAFTGADRRRVGLFEAADGGTLFLDEVGEIPLHLQSKLLRVLQDGEVHPLGSPRPSRVNVRVIAATNRDLRDRVTDGSFREDLYYRLNVITIPVPSLRERIGDVRVLVKHFLGKYGEGRKVKVSKGAWSKLESYDWPGNVRQLENEVRRALALCEGVIEQEDLTEQVRGQRGVRAVPEGLNMRARVDALERTLVQEAMNKTGGNQTRAARVLGVSRYGLQKMIKRLGIE